MLKLSAIVLPILIFGTPASMLPLIGAMEPVLASAPIGRPFSVSCGEGFEPESAPLPQILLNNRPISEASEDTSPCMVLYEKAEQLTMERKYQQAYDTGRHFIETCANTPRSFRGFSPIRSGAQFRSDSIGRWNELREWVKTVLYLNTTDPLYYCSGVNLLFMSFNHVEDRGKDYEGMIALYDYVIQSGKCLDDTATYIKNRREIRELQYKIWADSVRDSLATPFDTTKVTLEELGLEWVKSQSSISTSGDVLKSV